MDLKDFIRSIPDYPKKGILFRDVTTLFKHADAFEYAINSFYERYKNEKIDAIVGIESRGFILGAALAYKLKLGFVPIRKKGKLPASVFQQEYELEYGTDQIEIHQDALAKGARVILIDDLLATGGTILGARKLLKHFDAEIIECSFVIDLPDLGGSKKLLELGLKVHKLIDFGGH
jgi:adenine phosphoribosyltransferase